MVLYNIVTCVFELALSMYVTKLSLWICHFFEVITLLKLQMMLYPFHFVTYSCQHINVCHKK